MRTRASDVTERAAEWYAQSSGHPQNSAVSRLHSYIGLYLNHGTPLAEGELRTALYPVGLLAAEKVQSAKFDPLIDPQGQSQ